MAERAAEPRDMSARQTPTRETPTLADYAALTQSRFNGTPAQHALRRPAAVVAARIRHTRHREKRAWQAVRHIREGTHERLFDVLVPEKLRCGGAAAPLLVLVLYLHQLPKVLRQLLQLR